MKTKICILIFVFMASISLYAQSGTCGPNLTWTLQNGVLTISGSGNMNDYSWGKVPWYYYRQSITSVTIGNSVTSIGGYAFEGCSGLTSVTIPNSVTQIGIRTFYGCSGLTSVSIPNSVTSIGDVAFQSCSSLTSPVYNAHVFAYLPTSYSGAYTIHDGIESIAGGAFFDCSGLTSITIPNSVTSIGDYAFSDCSTLQTIYLKSSTPSQLGYDVFRKTGLTNIYVPCGALNTYQNAEGWSSYASYIKNEPSIIQGVPLVEGTGSVNIPQTICEDTIEAIPAYGYHFVQWTDGNTDNPRIINPKIEATYIAEFAADKSGKCGDDLLLAWVYDSNSKKLTISGNGKLDSNIYYGIEAPHEMTTLVIENGVQSIGGGAFRRISSLTSVSIGKDVTKINESAFYNCENLSCIRNYATIPATVYSNTFDGVNKFACTLYVPNESIDMYKSATGWRDFYTILGFDEESAIESVTEDSASRKIFLNGALHILLSNGMIYDATGRRIQ